MVDSVNAPARPRLPQTTDGVDAVRLASALDALGVAIERASQRYRDDVASATEQHLLTLLEEWVANTRMQVDYLRRGLAEWDSPSRQCAEVERARRDLSRWTRRCIERTDARIQSAVPAHEHRGWLDGLGAEIDGMRTLSAPFDVDALDAEPAHGVVQRWHLWRARHRSGRPRAVPMKQIAWRRVWTAAAGEAPRAMRDCEAMRALFWRRLRQLILEVDELWCAASAQARAGASVDWSAFDHELDLAQAAVRTEIQQFAGDMRKHLVHALGSALRAARRDARVCDTPLLPVSDLPRAATPAGDAIGDHLVDEAREWEKLSAGLAAECAAILDGTAYAAALAYALHRDAARLEAELGAGLLGPIQELAACVDGGADGSRSFCASALAWLDDGERAGELLESVESVLSEFDRSTRRAAERVTHQFDVIPAAVAQVLDHEPPPHVAPRRVALRAMAETLVAGPHRELLSAVARDVDALVQRSTERVADLVRVVEVRAADEADPQWREALHEKAMALKETTAAEIATVVEALRAGRPDASERLVEQLRHLEQQQATSVPVQPRARLSMHAAAVRQPAHLPPTIASADDLVDLMQGLTLERHVNRAVSRSYWRLVSDAGLDALSRDIGLQDELQRVARALRAWEEGDPEAVAVVGKPGAGKSLLLYRVARETMRDYGVTRLSLDRRCPDAAGLSGLLSQALWGTSLGSVEAIREELATRDEKRVVFVEHGERLFLRHVRGLDAVRAMLHLITATADRVLWVVTFETLAFEFLASVLHLAEAFTQVVRIRPLSRDEMERFVLARHRPSELPLRFARRSGESEEAAQRRFFDELYARTGGHPPLSLYGWLMAARDRDGAVELADVPRVPPTPLEPIDVEKCVALATVMMHGSLDAADFAATMRMPRDEAASLLAALRHLHLVEADSLGQVSVGDVRYRPLAIALEQRRIL